MHKPAPDTTPWIHALGPASLSNLGPGFDTLGLCIEGWGDKVSVCWHEGTGIIIEQITGDGGVLPTEPAQNTAAVAAQWVCEQAGIQQGLRMQIQKGIPLGSGIGGSSASAVGGAWATNVLLGYPFTKAELVEAVLAGEAVASGSRHGDNVLPALFGGLVLVSANDPTQYRQIVLPKPLPIALILPQVTVLTSEARACLPAHVPLHDAIHNASDLVFLLDAFRAGDWVEVGRRMMRDRLVEPVRAKGVPCYEAVRQAALAAGAFGCALTGSGPAMFAVAEDEAQCNIVLDAMLDASFGAGVEAIGKVVQVNRGGVESLEEG